MTAGERLECPGCLSVTEDVANEVDAGRPCPHCKLPAALFPVVQRARNGRVADEIVDALVTYGRAAQTRAVIVEQVTAENRDLRARAEEADTRAAQALLELRGVHADSDRALTGMRRDLRAAQWRVNFLTSAMQRALTEPVPPDLSPEDPT